MLYSQSTFLTPLYLGRLGTNRKEPFFHPSLDPLPFFFTFFISLSLSRSFHSLLPYSTTAHLLTRGKPPLSVNLTAIPLASTLCSQLIINPNFSFSFSLSNFHPLSLSLSQWFPRSLFLFYTAILSIHWFPFHIRDVSFQSHHYHLCPYPFQLWTAIIQKVFSNNSLWQLWREGFYSHFLVSQRIIKRIEG